MILKVLNFLFELFVWRIIDAHVNAAISLLLVPSFSLANKLSISYPVPRSFQMAGANCAFRSASLNGSISLKHLFKGPLSNNSVVDLALTFKYVKVRVSGTSELREQVLAEKFSLECLISAFQMPKSGSLI